MLILGVNMFHSDASAALLVDGKVVFAVAEERLNRHKHYAGVPLLSIQACLEHVGAKITDIEHLAVGRDTQVHLQRKLLYGARHPHMLVNLTRMRLQGRRRFKDLRTLLSENFDLPIDALRFQQHNVEHHVAHIASAFYPSGFDSAAGFSCDGSGDWVTAMLARCEGNRIDVLDRVFIPHSLGLFYSMVSQFIGFGQYGDEGKVMALAALGGNRFKEQIAGLVEPHGSGFRLNLDYFQPVGSTAGIEIAEDGSVITPPLFSQKMVDEFGPPRERHGELKERDLDLAHALQSRFEDIYLHLVQSLHGKYNSSDLVIAGGCALNSVANGLIFDQTPFERMWIHPAAGDEGLSVGAALYCWHQVLGHSERNEMKNAYLGPEYSEREIASELEGRGVSFRRLDTSELLEKTSSDIAAGKVVGWFQGRVEWGPRALGNRSIVAHPSREDMRGILNSRIKHREPFRPFAPSMMRDHLGDYFDPPHESPFMLHALPVKKEKQADLAAVVHVDGTARLQSVEREQNPLYYDLIDAVRQRTGVAAVLNTSFNENEPIVCSPEEAIDCFLRTRIDTLVIGPFVAERESDDSTKSTP